MPDIDLHKYYSNFDADTLTEEEDRAKKPVVISLKNASFGFNKFNQSDNSTESSGSMSFLLSQVSGDIKKVRWDIELS